MHPIVKGPLMKKLCFPVLFSALSLLSYSQQTYYYTDPSEKFNQAKEFFQKGEYSLAYPLFRELQQSLKETDRINRPIEAQEINYYSIASGLMQNESRAEQEAI